MGPHPSQIFKNFPKPGSEGDPDTSFENNWAESHLPRVPPRSPSDLRHLINQGKKIQAWKEKSKANERKWRIIQLKEKLDKLIDDNDTATNDAVTPANDPETVSDEAGPEPGLACPGHPIDDPNLECEEVLDGDEPNNEELEDGNNWRSPSTYGSVHSLIIFIMKFTRSPYTSKRFLFFSFCSHLSSLIPWSLYLEPIIGEPSSRFILKREI